MDRSLITASVTMGQLQKSLDLISNNLANVSTTGYKGRHASFSSLLVQELNNQPNNKAEVARRTPYGIRQGSGAYIGDTQLNMASGTLMNTERPLDLALTKDQLFFQVEGQDANGNTQTQYTRDGAFYLQPEAGKQGQLGLVDKNGQYILGKNGHIEIPADYQKITIDQQGNIQAILNDGTKFNAGTLDVVQVKRPQLLEAVGNNKLILPNLNNLGLKQTDVLASPIATDYVKQGALESSNVDMTDEMTELMNVQRSYQLNARAVNMADQMMGLVNSIR